MKLRCRFFAFAGACLFFVNAAQAQLKKIGVDSFKSKLAASPASSSAKSELKRYETVITPKAVSSTGMFKVHEVDDRYYFEIADSMLGRDILTVARISKGAVGVRAAFSGYAGDEIGENVIRFEKGPNNKLFIKNVILQETGRDSVNGMYWNVINSNMQPIAASYEIKALSPDDDAYVIDVTDLITGDNEWLYFDGGIRRTLGIGGFQSDKSYVNAVKAYAQNIEINSIKTYGRSSSGNSGQASNAANATFEINASLVLLPKVAMQPRYYDDRVGYITTEMIEDFDLNPQGVERIRFIRRFRLEPAPADMEKYKRGELVEPLKPIVFYIDPTTPRKWIPYLIQGINDWQAAFEKAGFKNAIIGKPAPGMADDSSWNLQDARHNAIIYKPSDVANASGPSIIDPRSGEILEAHINWYHNIMSLLRSWYFVQTGTTDTRAAKIPLDDELMGQLIRFASSHEVGHTLGLLHNFGASSTVPIEKLRDKDYLTANGHTPSIMDYARFNYVAQPEDGIPASLLMPRIGNYDKWAIEWGYRLYPAFSNADAEKNFLNKLTGDSLAANKSLFFGDGESNRDDPRNQTEDLGDNAMKASTYGIKNLQRLMLTLPAWAMQPGQDYTALRDMYAQVIWQFTRYCNHVYANIGGIERTPKRPGQTGAVYEYTSKAKQQQAINWLRQNVFTTPAWLVNKTISSLTNQNASATIALVQDRTLNFLMSANTTGKLLRFEAEAGSNAYTVPSLFSDLRKGIFSELAVKKPVGGYRRVLQKSFTEKLITMIDDSQAGGIVFSFGSGGSSISQNISRTSDVISVARATLGMLRAQIKAALPATTDPATRYHLSDIAARIDKSLNTGK